MKQYLTTFSNNGKTTFLSLLYSPHVQTISLDMQSFHMQKNDIILCRQNIQWNTTKKIHSINFNSSVFDELFYTQIADCKIIYDFLHTDSQKSEYLYFQCAKDKETLQILQLFQNELKYVDVYHNKMMNVYLTALFTSLDRSHSQTLLLANSTMVSDHIFGKILKYMGDHYSSCSIQEIAEHYGYHPDYLSSYFKKITGVPFRKKLLSIRLSKAEEFLLTTDYTVEQISMKVGFQDKSWFQKKFKEYYGITPARYRREKQSM